MGRDFGCYTLGTFLLLGRPEIICVKGNSRQHSLSCLVLVIPQEQGLTLAVCCFLPDFFLVPAEQVASSGGIAFFLVRLVILERGGWGMEVLYAIRAGEEKQVPRGGEIGEGRVATFVSAS